MKSTIATSNYFPENVYEDPDAIRVKLISETISRRPAHVLDWHFLSFHSHVLSFSSLTLRWDQSIVTDVNELEVKAKPVPRPRSKMHLKPLPSTNSNVLGSAEAADSTSNGQVSFLVYLTMSESWCCVFITTIVLFLQVLHYYECPANSTHPKPVRPPPKPPANPTLTSNKSTVCPLNSDTGTSLEVNDLL